MRNIDIESLANKTIVACMQKEAVSVIISPNMAIEFVNKLSKKKICKKEIYVLPEYEEHFEEDLKESAEKSNPMMITLETNGEIITEMYHPEYSPDGYCNNKYMIEEKYIKKCGSILYYNNYTVFTLV